MENTFKILGSTHEGAHMTESFDLKDVGESREAIAFALLKLVAVQEGSLPKRVSAGNGFWTLAKSASRR